MIHSYKLGGYNIVLDICSGAVHLVDEVAFDIINMYVPQYTNIAGSKTWNDGKYTLQGARHSEF